MVNQLFDLAYGVNAPVRALDAITGIDTSPARRRNSAPAPVQDALPADDAAPADGAGTIAGDLSAGSAAGSAESLVFDEHRRRILEEFGIDVAGLEQSALISQAVLQAKLAIGPDPADPGAFLPDIIDAMTQVDELTQTAAGNIRLDDGSVITLDQYQSLDNDPLAQAQIKQHLVNKQIALENQSRALVNEFGLQKYDISRAGHNDANAAAVSNFRNRSQEFRDRLALDELTLDSAVEKVDRQLRGLGENRSRVQLEAQTAADFAPTGTTGGKVAFTGADVGEGITNLFRQAGVQNPETSELIRFPGVISVDPAGRMAQRDEALGVGGTLAGIPDLRVGPGDIPNAPQISGFGGIPPELLQLLGPASLDIAGLLAQQAGGGGAGGGGALAGGGGGNQTPGAIEGMFAEMAGRMSPPTAAGGGGGGQGGAAPFAHGLDFLDPRNIDIGAILGAFQKGLVNIPSAGRQG